MPESDENLTHLQNENPETEPERVNFWVFMMCCRYLSGYDIEPVVISADLAETLRKLSGSVLQATRRWSRRFRPLQGCCRYSSTRRERQNKIFHRKRGQRDTASTWRQRLPLTGSPER